MLEQNVVTCGGAKVAIRSDFVDFYDSAFYNGDTPLGVYNRNESDLVSITKGLAFLRGIGINTLGVNAVKNLNPKSGRVLVYVGDSLGNQERLLMEHKSAKLMYPNMPASEFEEDSGSLITRVLQVGSRRFRITITGEFNCDGRHGNIDYGRGNIESIVELASSYNQSIRLPIFSIDYISSDNGMVATAFNNIEKLERYHNLMRAEDVVDEVYRAMIRYNMLIGS